MNYTYKHTNLIQAFKSFLEDHKLLLKEEKILLAVSGGIDSVVMATLFYHSQIPYAIAHCNFGLRDKASEEDELFVRHLAERYGAPFYTKKFDTKIHTQKVKCSIQMAARWLRYTWFNQLCMSYGYGKVATAHHANDLIETVLFNLTKGTGIAGLRGILPNKGGLIRPLLFATKTQLLQYAHEQNLTWREDSSNHTDTYARNVIRNHVIPPLQTINPQLETAITNSLHRLAQVESFFMEGLVQLKKDIFRQEGDKIYLQIDAIYTKPWAPVVCWEWLKTFGFNFVQIEGLFRSTSNSGKIIDSSAYQLITGPGKWLVREKKPDLPFSPIMLQESCNRLYLSNNCILVARSLPAFNYQILSNPVVGAFDASKLIFPLVVRTWQRGDIFYPLGMQQRKKVSDLLIDRKVPLWDKNEVYVVTSGKSLIWVVGYQLDDRFKITTATEEIYELTLIHKTEQDVPNK